MFTTKKLAQALGATGLLLGANLSAYAATCPETNDPLADYRCMQINVGPGKPAFGDGKTAAFYELGITGSLSTSIYTPGLAVGSTVIDTNITSVLNSFGVVGTTTAPSVAEQYAPLFGPADASTPDVQIRDTAIAPSEKDIDSLNPISGAFGDNEGFNVAGGWGLTYNTYLVGTLLAGGAVFNSGYIDVFYDDFANGLGADAQVLRINITGSNLDPANLALYGTTSFDFDGGAPSNDCTTVFCQNFWNFQTSVPSQWYALDGLGLDITMTLDTNVDPPIPDPYELREFTDGRGQAYWVRQTNQDGSVRFNVPEPGTIALLGIGLVGMGFRVGRRSRSA